MKKIYFLCIFVCYARISLSQSVGDYRTSTPDSCEWTSPTSWEVFNGQEWESAHKPPCKEYAPEKITIRTQCYMKLDVEIRDIPIKKLTIEPAATLVIQKQNFTCEDSVLLQGTFIYTPTVGGCVFNGRLIINAGTMLSKYETTCSIQSLELLDSLRIDSEQSITLDIQDSCIVRKQAVAIIEKVSLIARNHTYIQGTIKFTSTAGEKKFHGTVHIHEGTWISTAGETFTFNNNLFIQDASMVNIGAATYHIHKNLVLEYAHFPRIDSTNIYAQYIINDSIICKAHSYSTIEIGSFDCNTIDVFGSLDFTGKVGEKRIRDNFTIHTSGHFSNSDNESFSIGGNVRIYGTFSSGNGIYYLEGMHKYIHGGFECDKLYINGVYTNKCVAEKPLFVKDEFTGTGTLIQDTNSYIKTRAPSIPNIIADVPNHIEFTGNKTSQAIRGGTYHTIILDNPKTTYTVDSSITITHSLIFNKAQLLNVNGHSINFNSWNDSSLICSIEHASRIMLKGGSITAQNVAPLEKIFFPVALNSDIETYAGIEIQNIDSVSHDFTIDSLVHAVYEHPYFASDNPIQTQAVQCTYFITSTCKQAYITLFWHKMNELLFFEQEVAAIHHYNGLQWHELITEHIHCFDTNVCSITARTDSFSPFCIASNTLLLPIILHSFTVDENIHTNTLSWKTENEEDILYFTIEKSYTGTDFFELAHISGQGSTNMQQTYTYSDVNSGVQAYYRLSHTNIHGITTYHTIVSTNPPTHIYITHKNNFFQIRSTHQSTYSLKLYNIQGQLQESALFRNYYETAAMTHGLYILSITNCTTQQTHSYYVHL